MIKICKKENAVILAPIPALLIGTIIMRHNNISVFVYGQNIICYLILGLLVLLFTAKPIHALRSNSISTTILIVLGCILLAFTFLDFGLENVHRWLTIGSFRLYISSIALPCMIISFAILLKNKSAVVPFFLSAVIMLLIAFQPDASQLSAFAVSITLLFWVQTKQRPFRYAIALLSISLIIYSWLHLDTLKAVPHVEDIVLLARDMGIIWFLLAILSLGVLLIPFICFHKISIYPRTVGLYYLVVFISTLFGNFPVPIMGFGISPIIGYMLTIFFLLRRNAAN